jgi:nicotinate-nucleotide adenylyltransferase
MALEVGEELGLDRVCLVPAALPPHKGARVISPFSQRLAMTRLAIQGASLLDVSDLEGRREGPSYTVWTLQEVRDAYEEPLDLYFIVGTDAFIEIETWKEYSRLFDYAHFVLVERPGVSSRRLEDFLESLDLGLEKSAQGEYRVAASGKRIVRMETTSLNISSTFIRDAVYRGRSIRYLLPESVESYIQREGLYKLNEES